MDIFGVGPLEVLFILIIALIIMGPNDMVKAGRTLGRFLRKLVTSPTWTAMQQTSREIRNLPTRLIREAGLEDIEDELPNPQQIRRDLGIDTLKKDMDRVQNDLSAWTTVPNDAPEPTIAPPSDNPTLPGEPPQLPKPE